MILGSENTERPKLLNLVRETPLSDRCDTVRAIIESLPTDEQKNAFHQDVVRIFNLLDRVNVLTPQ